MDGFEMISSQPGQLSLAVDKLKGNQDLTRQVQTGLAAIRGIQQVSTDPDRGLLVVAYDKNQLTSFTSLLALKAALASFFPEVDAMKLVFWLSQSLCPPPARLPGGRPAAPYFSRYPGRARPAGRRRLTNGPRAPGPGIRDIRPACTGLPARNHQ